ncbi:MAG: permease-like cell division protein FtsX [Bacteroidales bacterium]|jgi:cell division transport system permease protein|nr:permease-like cell division protein FtsX [Bacteroidales bacterium]
MAKKDPAVTKRRLRSSYLTSVISITLVLFMLGVLGLLILNAQRLSEYVKENIGFSIILKENVKEVDVILLQKSLDAAEYVKSTKYITKEQAAKELQEELGENFIEFLGYNPLLASIEVHLYADYANPDSIRVIEKDFQQYEQIKEVFYQKSLVSLVNENIRKISLIILVFSGLLFLIALALINNTIRLSVYSKRFIINTMQLVGATRGFIRRPFLYRSVWQGILSALLAIGLLIGVVYLAQKEFKEVINLQDIEIIGILFFGVLVLGIVINWISTFFAVTKYLRMNVDKLYY